MSLFFTPQLPQIIALLKHATLPTADLKEPLRAAFFACGQTDQPSGIVGLEIYGPIALLRSLAVHADCRGHGMAKALISHAESQAMQRGANKIYLLTTSAHALFLSQNYALISRASVPAAIKNSSQFAALCPANATVLFKSI